MLRTIIIAENTDVQLTIPKEYVGKEIEITILALDELAESKPINVTMADFWNTMSDDTANTLHKDVEKCRNEWE
ncbi:hypothetical protein [Mucilaginibacter flavidus]|uniref:hypothetical protein n=1 Tax=Mucilaginibacter flavidus TaxID=2949309 RepID=UPI0020921124|nr:hypothetical protein [Mucilaginibacter flavidus]